MNRKTAYKIAIKELIEARRKFAFDHNLGMMYPATRNELAEKKYERITQAISILEQERDHKQMEMQL